MMFMRSLSWRNKFTKKDHTTTNNNNPNHEDPTTPQQQQQVIPQLWLEDEVKVKNATCHYPVEYLGHTEVFESRGVVVCEKAIRALKSQNRRKCKKAMLHISGDAIRVVDEINKVLLVDQTLEKVSFCAPDRNLNEGFAYICRDAATKRWLCHGFLAIKDSGDRISHALGTAFAVCLERKVTREKLLAAQMTSTPTTSAMNTPTTTNNNNNNNNNGGDDNDVFSKKFYFRQASLIDRINDPQITMVTDPIPKRKVENRFEIKRPHASLKFHPGTSILGSNNIHDNNIHDNNIHDNNNINDNNIHDNNNNISNANDKGDINVNYTDNGFSVNAVGVNFNDEKSDGGGVVVGNCNNSGKFVRQFSTPTRTEKNRFNTYCNNDSNNNNRTPMNKTITGTASPSTQNNTFSHDNKDDDNNLANTYNNNLLFNNNINSSVSHDDDVFSYRRQLSCRPDDMNECLARKIEFLTVNNNDNNRLRKLSEAESWLQNISTTVNVNNNNVEPMLFQHQLLQQQQVFSQQQQQPPPHNPFQIFITNHNIHTTPTNTITGVNDVNQSLHLPNHQGGSHNYSNDLYNYSNNLHIHGDNLHSCSEYSLQPIDYIKSAPVQLSTNNPFL